MIFFPGEPAPQPKNLSISGQGSIPQGLKPASFSAVWGTAEAVLFQPCPNYYKFRTGSTKRQARFFSFAIVLLLLQSPLSVFPLLLFARPFAAAQAAGQPQDELGKRLKAASVARDSRDQAAV